MLRFVLALVLLSLLTIPTAGQARAQAVPEFGINGLLGFPQADFADRADVGGGLNVFGGLSAPGSPVSIGLKVGYMVYGSGRISDRVAGVNIDVVTENDIVLTHFVVRLRPPGGGTFVPFVDGLVGFKYLFTQTRIEDDNFFQRNEITRQTEFDDWAFSYGAGGGVMVRVHRGAKRRAFLKVGADYLIGSEADYLNEDTGRDENGELIFDLQRSRTTILIPRLGVLFRY